ncbi:MAG: response regulator transcription factor [Lachnospiraceae bacterium]|jgi:two-component system response regulator protein BraR/BceR|nr:response regulator transcription factor [Lachnospiraceae bacterium]MCX4315792.1 response regulator transcription factor [Lachnospiraceae bacterium]
MLYRILIVEDDETIAGAVKRQVESWGLSARCIKDFSKVIEEFCQYAPHLVLMDITLPFFNGYHWCSEIRKLSKVPVIFLSSASDSMNIVMAVNMGADDFLAKPFDLEVLTAKVQAVLRRTYDFGMPADLLSCRGAVLDQADASLRTETGERVELTKNEYRLLQILFENQGKVVSRDTMMTKLWESDAYVDENTLNVNMARLRKKLEQVGFSDLIVTRKGIGYLIEKV